ncbi:FecR family protein [Methylomonas sp. CM2]|uniref:FecR family protein n=1 Tax=Methylomonas sp. CM2 TaxID=3417647 RepID=UPI003CEEE971
MTDSVPDNAKAQAVADQAMHWFARLRGDSASLTERDAFAEWYAADSAHRAAYDDIARFWQDDDLAGALADFSISASALPARRRVRYRMPLLAVAASLALAAVVLRPGLSCLRADFCSAVGEVRNVELADGSRITLNSDTALSVDYRASERLVHLAYGEAYFEVSHNPEQPFVVDSKHCRTRVLGTRFIVRDGVGHDEVSVLGGSVEVGQGRQVAAVLKANDSIAVGADQDGGRRKLAPAAIGAWLKGSAVFDNATLAQVVAELSRYRRGRILIKDAATRDLKVSGRFNIADTDQALEALRQTLPIRLYKLTPWLVVIG